jgi:phenylpyruvate tautomerase PptA (4-oxalocrotonate tautomerase family)
MVFVRVHVVKGYLSTEQKRELGDKLVAAVAEAEGLHNSERHQQTSWIQYFELDRENWYAPALIGDTNALVQVDMIAPQDYVRSEEDARTAIEKVTGAIREVVGEGLLPGRGPWVQLYVIPHGQWGMDGLIPNFEAARAYFAAGTHDEAVRVLETVMGQRVDPAQVS